MLRLKRELELGKGAESGSDVHSESSWGNGVGNLGTTRDQMWSGTINS